MAKHPQAHRGAGLSNRLRIIQKSMKKTEESKDKKGVRVKKPKFNPFSALKILITPGAKK